MRNFAARLRLRQPPPATTFSRALRRGRVRLYWWNKRPNVGDVVAPVIVAAVSGREVVRVGARGSGKLLAVGSVLHRARSGDVVWGSGAIKADAKIRTHDLDVRAVRGPLTRELLRREGIECPEVYGDPALLLPEILPRRPTEAGHRLGIVPHYVDKARISLSDPAVCVIDVEQPVEAFLEALWGCERVVSSSLHGIIIAEAYGIPAAWMRLSDDVVGGGFKFHDYYLSTSREPPGPLALSEIFDEVDWVAPTFDRAALRRSFPGA